jgi:hypothetical protein
MLHEAVDVSRTKSKSHINTDQSRISTAGYVCFRYNKDARN